MLKRAWARGGCTGAPAHPRPHPDVVAVAQTSSVWGAQKREPIVCKPQEERRRPLRPAPLSLSLLDNMSQTVAPLCMCQVSLAVRAWPLVVPRYRALSSPPAPSPLSLSRSGSRCCCCCSAQFRSVHLLTTPHSHVSLNAAAGSWTVGPRLGCASNSQVLVMRCRHPAQLSRRARLCAAPRPSHPQHHPLW